MDNKQEMTFSAPWSGLLKAVSIVGTGVCLSVVFGIPRILPVPLAGAVVTFVAVALLAGAALCTVRGYLVTPDSILVKRLLWSTRLPRTGILSAAHDPGATRGSIRTCGNGGMYSFTGWYWNKELGSYRMFATDLTKSVVLRYATRRVVVSPGDPERFVRTVMER